MKRSIIFSLLIIYLTSLGLTIPPANKKKKGQIKIEWKNSISGDFSFKDNWQYPEGIYTNEFGQLSCDGLCPTEVDRMKDENGQVFSDSLDAFYQLVDTTHQFFSIQSVAWCYEWAGTNIINVTKINKDTVFCVTQTNAATHSSLHLVIAQTICTPTIELTSINSVSGNRTYKCKSGAITIDRTFWERGILKAEFDFTFLHEEDPKRPMYWKGKIYAKM